MKRIASFILSIVLLLSLFGCAGSGSKDPNAEIKKALVGEWRWKEYPNNPIYSFLRFEGEKVQYGTNLFGEDIESVTWDCTYTINDTALDLTTSDGTVFIFEIQKDGDTIRIFNDLGKEFIHID